MLPESLGSLLHRCANTKALPTGIALHAAVLKHGHLSDTILSNHIINIYSKCNCVGLARKLFDEMPQRNLVSWGALLSGYDHAREPYPAVELYTRMQPHFVPNEFVLASVISACGSVPLLSNGRQVHAQGLKLGFVSASFVSNALISFYMKCGLCDDARGAFDSSGLSPNVVSYNALIAGYVENEQPERGMEAFKWISGEGLIPDRFSLAGALRACTDMNDLPRGVELHTEAKVLGLHSTAFVGNVLMQMYCVFGLVDQVERVFKDVEEKDVISWNTLISACCHCGDFTKGLGFFRELLMRGGRASGGIEPDNFSFANVLSACAGLASICHGKQVHGYLLRRTMLCNKDAVMGNALINMYARCGSVGYASTAFRLMADHRNLVSWNTIIAGFGTHGLGEQAFGLFLEMKENGMQPDCGTFIAILIACNHAGMVEEGTAVFDSMEEVYGIKPGVEHFSCLIDMLGRSGRFEDAERYIKRYPFEDNHVVLGSLLSACRLHGEVPVGERLGEALLKLQPESSSPFVLLSNLYASDRTWGGVAEVRRMLKGSGIKKEPAQSWIEVKGIVERFTIGDFSHPHSKEIRIVIRTLSMVATERKYVDLFNIMI